MNRFLYNTIAWLILATSLYGQSFTVDAPKIILKKHWRINDKDSSINYHALLNIKKIFNERDVPFLAVIMPMNFTYYDYIGVDLDKLVEVYEINRKSIMNSFGKYLH